MIKVFTWFVILYLVFPNIYSMSIVFLPDLLINILPFFSLFELFKTSFLYTVS